MSMIISVIAMANTASQKASNLRLKFDSDMSGVINWNFYSADLKIQNANMDAQSKVAILKKSLSFKIFFLCPIYLVAYFKE